MKTLPIFCSGQCWMSEGEPELGAGFVREQDQQSVTLTFPATGETRRYGKRTAPLRRLEFRLGESVSSAAGARLVIERIEERAGLFWYLGGGKELCESELSPKLKLQRPLQRFLAGQWDPLKTFDLRRRALSLWHRQLRSPARGLVGPRAQLLPHQLYVARQVSGRGLPRALLADEVGLGKTIEAGWILHRLVVTGRVRRVLVLAPGPLVNQWFIELFRRFNLPFWVPDSQSEEGVLEEDLRSQERVILSLDSIVGLSESAALPSTAWDLVIVDEAHRVSGPAYAVLQALAARAPGLLLLTATPEQLGLEGHFARLQLIDPVRFASFADFEKEYRGYRDVVKLAEALHSGEKLKKKDREAIAAKLEGKLPAAALEELGDAKGRRTALAALVDHYGTGRVYFRNSRQVVELEHCFFPKRKLVRHELKRAARKGGADPFLAWLGDFAKAHRGEKTLLIATSAERVIELERRLKEDHALKAVAFHEGLPLLARDRNAAYFEDAEGASILLSSEIGGEGRNFQHARHLVLADLPEDPDTLEQRIGRLDRIGQTSDISIHVPFVPGSREESLLRWYDEVFRAFDAPPKGAAAVHARHRAALASVLGAAGDGTGQGASSALDALASEASADYARTLQEIEAGRDRLIELNSFDPDAGACLAREIQDAERSDELREFLESVFDVLGIHSEDLDAESLFVEPGDSMYATYFPALPAEGIRMTFSRSKALARDDLALMTWDHPMVTGAMEAIASQEVGNTALATWDLKTVSDSTALVVEASFVLEPLAVEGAWNAEEFLGAEPIRVVMDGTGKDLSSRWTPEALRAAIAPMPPEGAKMALKLPSQGLRGLLTKALKHAEGVSEATRETALARMRDAIGSETRRLEALKDKNGMVAAGEIEWWRERGVRLQASYEGARVRLDSFMLVMPSLGRG